MNVLFFLQPGTNSRGVMIDIIAGFRAAGHNPVIWECGEAMQLLNTQKEQAPAIRRQVSEAIASLIRQREIGLSVAMWANALTLVENPNVNGRLQTFFETQRVPHLLFWYDSPERAHSESLRGDFRRRAFDSPYLFHFINNAATAREMERAYGFSNVLPRGYGINPEIFKPEPGVAKEYDLSFSANFGEMPHPPQVVLDELSKDEPDSRVLRTEAAKLHWPTFEKLVGQLPESFGDARAEFLRELHRGQFEHRDVPVLDRVEHLASTASGAIKNAANVMLGDPVVFAAIATELRKLETWERAFAFCYLARFFKCKLFGKVDYRSMGCHVPCEGAVRYDQQRFAYSTAHIGLSVMRWQDERGLHAKPYEMMACGLPCVAQHRPGIEDHYTPGEEIEVFHTLGEARRKIEALLRDPERRAELARSGYERTLRDHTWANWANDMVSRIQVRLSAPPARCAA